MREFQLAEIEHFVNPSDKRHPKFERVRDLEVPLFSRERQEANQVRSFGFCRGLLENVVWVVSRIATNSGPVLNRDWARFIAIHR